MKRQKRQKLMMSILAGFLALLMLLPMGILAALCLALGLFPAPITALTGPVLGAIFG